MPSLGMPGVRKLRAETAKADAEHSMLGVRRLMVKCPDLEGRQRKMYKNKALLPESRVLTDVMRSVAHGH